MALTPKQWGFSERPTEATEARNYDYLVNVATMMEDYVSDPLSMLRSAFGVSVEDERISFQDGMVIVTLIAKDRNGRRECGTGTSVWPGIDGNGLKIAETQAKRRLTCSYAGVKLPYDKEDTVVTADPTPLTPEVHHVPAVNQEPATETAPVRESSISFGPMLVETTTLPSPSSQTMVATCGVPGAITSEQKACLDIVEKLAPGPEPVPDDKQAAAVAKCPEGGYRKAAAEKEKAPEPAGGSMFEAVEENPVVPPSIYSQEGETKFAPQPEPTPEPVQEVAPTPEPVAAAPQAEAATTSRKPTRVEFTKYMERCTALTRKLSKDTSPLIGPYIKKYLGVKEYKDGTVEKWDVLLPLMEAAVAKSMGEFIKLIKS